MFFFSFIFVRVLLGTRAGAVRLRRFHAVPSVECYRSSARTLGDGKENLTACARKNLSRRAWSRDRTASVCIGRKLTVSCVRTPQEDATQHLCLIAPRAKRKRRKPFFYLWYVRSSRVFFSCFSCFVYALKNIKIGAHHAPAPRLYVAV